ncbi:MAG: ArnT family glycosyltransferase [Planctomycetaceae bacterium]
MNPVDQPTSDPCEQPISRYELWAVVVITLLGAAVRFAFPSAMAIEHFDEGVYASNLLFPDQDFRYPDRHLYAPSLVPALIEWSIIFFGDKGIAPMLPSLLFGTLTIPLIWWVARQWFGPHAGIAAATLLSLSDFHIAFSRSALTDVPLCFWLLLAVYLFERTFRDLSWPTAIFAGVTTGLAWWTKYNGWLSLAISLSGLMAWSLFAQRNERHFLRRLTLWAVAAATALIVWSPYWLSLPNGYAEVAQNHSQYVGGFDGWRTRASQQLESLAFWNGPTAWLSPGLMIVSIVGLKLRPSHNQTQRDIKLVHLLTLFVVAVSLSSLAAGMSANKLLAVQAAFAVVAGVVTTCLARFRCGSLTPKVDGTISWMDFRFERQHWLMAAWFIGLSLSTPMYRAYPRLALPWLVVVFLGTASLLSAPDQNRLAEQTQPQLDWRKWATVLGVMAGFLIWIVGWHFPADSLRQRGWTSRTAFASMAADIRGDALSASSPANLGGIRAVLYVYAEPGLVFHLPTDEVAAQPAGNLNFLDIDGTRKRPTFLVIGPHADRSKAFADEFAKRADQFELIASYAYDASDFVRLDDVSATQLHAHREPLEVRLYRVRIPE